MTTVPTKTETAPAPKTLLRTSRFGDIEIDPEKIINLTSPFLGFPKEKRFVLLPHGDESAFWWFQAIDNPDLAFVVIQPAIISPQYNPSLHDSILQELLANDPKELEILIILTVPQGNPELMTANLLGPVVLNATSRLAKQVLLDPAQYSACWPVLQQK